MSAMAGIAATVRDGVRELLEDRPATADVTAASAYLLTELLLRPAAARALADGAPVRLYAPSD